ncbi:hypothetical protein A0H81_10145 [Grifola frondosa]|uniref:Uncharacterized protein n=1 Tax=Grifola frondosa TaxID=5627 RepID=A0A1C7LYK9_GRIFR|nr:hypothetical protein A0H81_10145 [Grifola frondosa]
MSRLETAPALNILCIPSRKGVKFDLTAPGVPEISVLTSPTFTFSVQLLVYSTGHVLLDAEFQGRTRKTIRSYTCAGAWFHDGFQVVLAIYLMYLTTAAPVLLCSGLLRARQRAILSSTAHEGSMVAIKKCCHFLYKEGLVELIFLWVLQMAVSVLNVLRFNPSGHLQSVLGYPACREPVLSSRLCLGSC